LRVQILAKFGLIILLNMILSVCFGLFLYTPLLMVLGPEEIKTVPAWRSRLQVLIGRRCPHC
jgi:hypothetical protein